MVQSRIHVRVLRRPRGWVTVAGQDIPAGTDVFSFRGAPRAKERNAYTIEIGHGAHIHDPGVLSKVNHSCDPNLVVDCDRQVYRSIRPISEGQELSYFYPSTESRMSVPFHCGCGSPRCIGWVKGASELSSESLSGHFINPHALDGVVQ